MGCFLQPFWSYSAGKIYHCWDMPVLLQSGRHRSLTPNTWVPRLTCCIARLLLLGFCSLPLFPFCFVGLLLGLGSASCFHPLAYLLSFCTIHSSHVSYNTSPQHQTQLIWAFKLSHPVNMQRQGCAPYRITVMAVQFTAIFILIFPLPVP